MVFQYYDVHIKIVSYETKTIHLSLFFPVNFQEHLSNGYPHINFRLLFLSSKPQTSVSQISINFSEVMDMTWTIPETVALPLLSIVSESKEGMSHTLSLTQYRFVNHFKSTKPYLPINFTVFNTITP